ncbi:hypothetical protein ACIRUY_01165 [Streptomyces erythrochromogenes]|uniref:hypothetical protein n=1 Tax=Streptomyces erythrochromogenes TaxID=285574 RepID=UPI0037F6853B
MTVLPTGRGNRRRRGRGGSIAASGALLLAVLASLTGQAAPAFAATAPPAAAPSQQHTASGGAAAKAGPEAPPKRDPQAEHEAAVRALQKSASAGDCPAALGAHAVVTCTLEPTGTASFSLSLPQQKDLVLLQVVMPGAMAQPQLVAPDGTTTACENVLGSGHGYGTLRCPTAQAGTYTLKIPNFDNGMARALSVSYVPLLSSTACKAVGAADRKLGAPTVFPGSLPAGSAGDCYGLDLAAGDVLRAFSPSWQVLRTVYDASGKEICSSKDNSSYALDCKLTGTAPFRASVMSFAGTAETYGFTAARLSAPEGCAVVEPQAFGASPDLNPTARCRTLRVAQAAGYAFGPVKADVELYGALFARDGTPSAPECGQGACDLAPGDHTWALDPRTTDADTFGMRFHSAKETRGCTATHDNGLAAGPATGTFGGPGQRLCLTLPTATGQGVYLLNRPSDEGTSAAVTVFDSAGAKQCEVGGHTYHACKLTGAAPFRAVLSGEATKDFRLVIHRTGDATGCAAWQQTGFDGTWGAQAPVSSQVRQYCLSLPADRHSTAEMIDYTNEQNRVNGDVVVVDPSGTTACSTAPGSTAICRLTAGVPYTAMVVFTGYGSDTYKLVRRDISPTAKCASPASTKVGGQSLPFDLTSALDARCVRVTGAATDKFWLSSRALNEARYGPSTTMMVVDADGKIVCRQWGISCQVTGSTSYVMVVVATGYKDKPIHTDVDTWKVASASGWSPECTTAKVSVDGFPVRSGVLTESATAYCAVIDVQPGQAFNVFGTTSAPDIAKPQIDLLSLNNWDSTYLGYQCGSNWGEFGARCQATHSADAGQALLLLSPARTATPVEYSIQGVCDTGCVRPPSQDPKGISPSSSPSGTRTHAVVSGTGLHLGTKMKVKRDGTERPLTAVSVNPEGTALTVEVDTADLTPGPYDLLLDGVGYTTGVPSRGYLPKAYTVTAPAPAPKGSRFVPHGPSRFLDTRDGTGAAKQRVGPGGVVTLQVAGVKGIPATGVTAVVMNVTAVRPTEAGHVMVYPNGQAVPKVSNLNFAPGQIVPNLVTVPVVNGKVDLRNNAGSVDLIADVTGYYTDQAGAGSAFNPITPARFLDTRDGTGAAKQRVGPGGVVTLQVAGVKGIPATGVTAVVMNVTAVQPTEAGHVTVYPNGQTAPGVSNLNFTPGQIVPNLVTVPVVNGKVDLRNNAGSVDLIADVTGYYAATGSAFSAAGPVRLLDTRDGTGARAGAVGPGGAVTLQVTGTAGVPAQGVTAVVLNVTVTNPTEAGHLIVHPHGTGRPGVSNLNYTPGQTVANLVVVPVVDGKVTFYNNSGSTDVIADLNGYFTS